MMARRMVTSVATLLVAFGVATTAALPLPQTSPLRLRGGASLTCGPSRDGLKRASSLSWTAISLTLDGRRILEDLSGNAREGRLLAVMGPSGAGKTSLLHILGGMLEQKSGQELHGRLDGPAAVYSRDDHTLAFVGQNDKFHAHLTVEETLMVAASLRLPGASKKERQKAVDKTLRQMQLKDVRQTRVGDDRFRGISGGERRRLALGCELVGKPRVVLADEPTSGLDAFQAERIISVLRGIAAQGCTVVLTIHQPSSKVWRMLDDVMLLTEGRCVYFGERISCLPTLRAAGYTCPPETNPAEFAIDVISVDASSQEKEIESCRRVRALVSAWSRCSAAASPAASALPAAACCGLGGAVVGKGGADKGEDGIADAGLKGRSGPGRPPGGKGLVGRLGRAMRRFRLGGERDKVGGGFSHRRIGPLRAFRVLLARSLKETARSHFVNIARAAATVVLAGLFGVVWGHESSVVDRIGSVVMTSINTSMIALVRALVNFVEERPVVARERRFFGALPYLLSKIVAEGPLDAFFAGLFGFMVHKSCQMTGDTASFVTHCVLQALASSAFGQLVGAVVPEPAAALAAGPPLMLVFVIVGAVGPSGRPNLPGWLLPLRDMSMIRYGCEGLCVNELSAPVKGYGPGNTGSMLDVQQRRLLLHQLGLSECSVGGALRGQLRLLAGCYVLTLGALIAGAPRPASLSAPDDAGEIRSQDAVE